MRRTMSHGALPPPGAMRRANSSKRALKYYSDPNATLESTVPVVMATVVPADPTPDSPLKVGMAVQVTKAGVWMAELARVKKVNADGTYDVSVFNKFSTDTGSLKEEFVLTNKPYPDEVRIAGPAAAARLEALANKPPDMFEPYKVRVVREHGGREEWGEIQVNKAGFRWEQTSRMRARKGLEVFASPAAARLWEDIPGANEKNHQKLLDLIELATQWRDLDKSEIYCGGWKLESMHMFRVHGMMSAGLPIVVVGEGQSYDRERWAPIAEHPSSGDNCCVVS
jgi:hypothetical protein